jgi:Mismatch repair ATPase (MutS family)
MDFRSILFVHTDDDNVNETAEMPAFFPDFNLDQVINAIAAGRQEYNLKPFYYTPLQNADAVNYRYEIMRDLEDKPLFDHIKSFSEKMRVMRRYLGLIEKLYNQNHKNGWFVEAVLVYCNAINCLSDDLNAAQLRSHGFLALREYMASYVKTGGFPGLFTETKRLKKDLSAIKYSLIIKDTSITVRKYESETDYSDDVEETFAKFKRGAVKDYRAKLPPFSGMNHIEAQILDRVAKLNPGDFLRLGEYCEKNGDFLNQTIGRFDREVQFYIAYLEFTARLKAAGLKFCYPLISATIKEECDYEGFDLALAYKLIGENSAVVCNDFYLSGGERIFVVSGPNQGGKTTFARAFGQIHYLAGLGCPVPGREARLFLPDRIFTHFEREEDINNLRGKLQDELVRIREILDQATGNSIIIINEIFTSTTLEDAILLGKKIMEKIIALDSLCVCVTFIDELASLGSKTVSVVSTVVPENPAMRTFKIVRRPADGLAHALSVVEKYRLTYGYLKERLK